MGWARKAFQFSFGLLPSPKSVAGFLGYFLVALYPISLVLSLLGNADLVAENVDRIKNILSQWYGYPSLAVLGFAVLMYAGYRQQSRQQPAVVAQDPESQSTAVTENPGMSQALSPADAEELEKQRAEIERLKKKVGSQQTEMTRLQDTLDRFDGDRQRFNELLIDAWSEGHKLRESEPTIEEVRVWQGRLETLLKRAVGDGHANRVLRAEPEFVSAIHGSTTEQRELESRLNRLDELRKNFQARDAIPFRSDFDPHEWEDWKFPPPTTEQARIDRLQAALQKVTRERDSMSGRVRELETMSPEEYRARQEERRKRIEKWRAEIQSQTFARHPWGGSLFAQTETYSEMRPRLSHDVRQRYESRFPPFHISPRKMGADGDRRVLLDEVARIEAEWGVV